MSFILESGKKEETSSGYSCTASPCASKMPPRKPPDNRAGQTRQCQPRRRLQRGHDFRLNDTRTMQAHAAQ